MFFITIIISITLILQKKKKYMNMYGHISYMIIHVYEYLCMFIHIYTYIHVKNFLPSCDHINNK